MRFLLTVVASLLCVLASASTAAADSKPLARHGHVVFRCSAGQRVLPRDVLCVAFAAFRASNKTPNVGPGRDLNRGYGFRPATISDEGRAAWLREFRRERALLRASVKICVLPDAAFRARVARADRKNMDFICGLVVHLSEATLAFSDYIAHDRPTERERARARWAAVALSADKLMLERSRTGSSRPGYFPESAA